MLMAVVVCMSAAVVRSQAGEKDKPPVEARLIVKQAHYVLPAARHGAEFRRRIESETDPDKLPPAPAVDLVLELKNVSQADVMIWPRGIIGVPFMTLKGPGVVEPIGLQGGKGGFDATGVQPVIAPGKTHRIAIKTLCPGESGPYAYWCQPGEYRISAPYTVHTNLPPFPFPLGAFSGNKLPGKKLPGKKPQPGKEPAKKPQQYEVTTPAVKVNVVLNKKS